MKFRSTVLATTLALLGAASLGAQAAQENLTVDNGSVQTAQSLGQLGPEGALNVFGARGTFDIFGTTIVDNNDADFYSFTVGANQIVTLRVDTPEGPLFKNDPVVGLYSTAGIQLIHDDDSGPGFDSLLSYTISAAGTYYAAVSGFADFDFNGVSDGCEGSSCVPSTNFQYNLQISSAPAPVPVPAAGWLLGSALLGLARRRKAA
jgi:hypothetical protein